MKHSIVIAIIDKLHQDYDFEFILDELGDAFSQFLKEEILNIAGEMIITTQNIQ